MKHTNRGTWVLGITLVILALVAAGCGASGQASSSGATGSTSGSYGASATALPAATNAAATGATEQPAGAATAATAATETSGTGSSTAATTTMSSTTGTTAGSAAAAGSGPAELMAGKDAKLGDFLADAKGMSLYMYGKDTKDTSNCYNGCAVAWPPLLTKGDAKAGVGLDQKLVGTTTRKDGSTQVTYNGMPLYYYAKDTKAGDVTGQGVGGVWYVVSPKGDVVKTQ